MKHQQYLSILFVVLFSISSHSNTIVYLVHGFGSNTFSLNSMKRYISRNNFNVKNWGYRSISKPIPEISYELYQDILSLNSIDTVHFVTHSMGGLVVRSLSKLIADDSSGIQIGKIVMLTPPNNGAQIADFFSKFTVINSILGPNLGYMKTDSISLANNLPKVLKAEVGIIAGACFNNFGYVPNIEGKNDGFMTIEKTKLGSEKDFLIVKEPHLFIMFNKNVKENVLYFLKYGTFIEHSK